MLSELDIIEGCLSLLSKPGRWTTKVCARDRKGKPVQLFSDDAYAFDLEGAIRRSAGQDDRTVYARFVKKTPLLEQIAPTKNLFDWNDKPGRTQKDVVMMLEDFADMYRFRDTG